MRRVLVPSELMAIVGAPIIAIVSAWCVSRLPHEVLHFILVWFLTSAPLAMLFGHCALGEADLQPEA